MKSRNEKETTHTKVEIIKDKVSNMKKKKPEDVGQEEKHPGSYSCPEHYSYRLQDSKKQSKFLPQR